MSLRWVFRVETEKITTIPKAIRDEALQGLNGLFFKRREAFRLHRLDRLAGGNPRMLRIEFERCVRCHRPMMGTAATNYRALGIGQMRCGDQCEQDEQQNTWALLAEALA
jgi:hypothetical protein